MNKLIDRNIRNKIYEMKPAKSHLKDLVDGDYFKGVLKILRKAQPGPVVFTLTDGYGAVDGVIKESEFEVDDVIEVSGSVSKRGERLQIDLRTVKKSLVNFDEIIESRSTPVRTEFSIKSERYDKMKQRFIDIAKRIRMAVFNNQPILIRHHNDSDGITAGLAIESACKLLMSGSGINPEYNLYRSPSKTPYYDTGDLFRDIVTSKWLTEAHKQKKPLILVLDNGSGEEDVFAFKILKSLGFESIVIDHHNPVNVINGRTRVCDYLLHHLNPYLFGLDSQTSAGMLCYELARFISEDFNNPVMPAVAAISDRCVIKETDDYIKASGFNREELTKIGVAIDFIAYNLRFDAGKGLFEELYASAELVNDINDKVRAGVETQLQSTLPYLRSQEIGGVLFSYIDLEKYTLRFTYPTPGKVIGLIHDSVSAGKEAPVLTIGYLSDMIIIRATKPVLPVHKLIEVLRKKIPEANVEGGGHEQAGTIKFVPAHLETIIELIKQELRAGESFK